MPNFIHCRLFKRILTLAVTSYIFIYILAFNISFFFILQTMYCWAQEAALSVTNNIVQSDSEILEVKVCTAALRLMLQILNWEFQYNTSAVEGTKKSINVFSSGVRFDVSSAKRSDYALVQVSSLSFKYLSYSIHSDVQD